MISTDQLNTFHSTSWDYKCFPPSLSNTTDSSDPRWNLFWYLLLRTTCLRVLQQTETDYIYTSILFMISPSTLQLSNLVNDNIWSYTPAHLVLDSNFTNYIYYYKAYIISWPKKTSYCEKPLYIREGWIKSKESKSKK